MKDLHVIISHESAARYWVFAQKLGRSCAVPPIDSIGAPSSNIELPDSVNTKPLHIMVLDPRRRHRSHSCIIHYFNRQLPPGSLRYSSSNASVVSPELNFIQNANVFSIAQTVEFANNLCAEYCIDFESRSIKRRSAPLTTLAKLHAFVKANPGLPGVKNARSALKWICEGSLSPMESKLATLFACSRNMGGYGMGDFVMNYRITPGKNRLLINQNYFLGDICWPDKKVVVEYDGLDYHSDIAHDKKRANGLEALGWRVFFLTRTEVFAPGALDLLARQVAHALGLHPKNAPGWKAKNLQLLKDLSLVRDIRE